MKTPSYRHQLFDTPPQTRQESELHLSSREKRVCGIYQHLRQRPEIAQFARSRFEQRLTHEAIAEHRIAKYEKTGSAKAQLVEDLIAVEAQRAHWFGDPDRVAVVQTTLYDDVENGADFVLEWKATEETNTPFYLVVDVTTAVTEDIITRKRNKKEGNVFYFESAFEKDASGQARQHHLHEIPHVILGVGISYLPELIKICSEHIETSEEEAKSGSHARLESRDTVAKTTFVDHPLRYLLLEQAIEQLEVQQIEYGMELASALLRLDRQSPEGKRLAKEWEELPKNAERIYLFLLEHRTEVIEAVKRRVIDDRLFVGLIHRTHLQSFLQKELTNAREKKKTSSDRARVLGKASRVHGHLTKKT